MIKFTSQEALLFRSCLLSSIWNNVSDQVPQWTIDIAKRAVSILSKGGIPEQAALVMGECDLTEKIWNEAVTLFYFVLSKRLLTDELEALSEIRARTGMRAELVIERVLAEHRAGRADWKIVNDAGIHCVKWHRVTPSATGGSPIPSQEARP